MKTRIHLTLALLIFGSLFARGTGNEVFNQTYIFKNIPAGVDITPYQLAVQNSDFECSRFENNRRVFVFDNGLQLEIFSAEEVRQNTNHVSNCFLPDNTTVPASTLSLGDNNTIIMVIAPGFKTNSSN